MVVGFIHPQILSKISPSLTIDGTKLQDVVCAAPSLTVASPCCFEEDWNKHLESILNLHPKKPEFWSGNSPKNWVNVQSLLGCHGGVMSVTSKMGLRRWIPTKIRKSIPIIIITPIINGIKSSMAINIGKILGMAIESSSQWILPKFLTHKSPVQLPSSHSTSHLIFGHLVQAFGLETDETSPKNFWWFLDI